MKTCEYAGARLLEARSHPWTDATDNPECRYYDLTAEPEHIRHSLEDFLPYGHEGAIDDFYMLLEALNGPDSTLESNDCAFSGPEHNDDPALPKPYQCTGRVMVLFRAIERNTSLDSVEQLKNQLHGELATLDRDFAWGVVGTTLVPTLYLALPEDEQLGSQLMISFWAWGDCEADTMKNLSRLFKNLARALGKLSRRARHA
jgi:hypothetical protein